MYACDCSGGSTPIQLDQLDIEWSEEQQDDPLISRILYFWSQGEKPNVTVLKSEPEDVRHILKEWRHLTMDDGALYRKVHIDNRDVHQLLLPRKYQDDVFKMLHSEMGHMGHDRTQSLIRDRFYWPCMGKDIEQRIKTCDRCWRSKATSSSRVCRTN